jgi:hypothetical protein
MIAKMKTKRFVLGPVKYYEAFNYAEILYSLDGGIAIFGHRYLAENFIKKQGKGFVRAVIVTVELPGSDSETIQEGS